MAQTRTDAEAALDAFIETYGIKYEKAVACLTKDRETLLAFYDFPAEHWKHLRTTDEIDKSARPRSRHCRSSLAAPVRRLPRPRGCHRPTNCS